MDEYFHRSITKIILVNSTKQTNLNNQNKTNMKKILAITILAATFAAGSAFAQGYVLLSSGKSQVYDGFTTAGSSALTSNVKVAFLWAAASTTTPMPIASTPTAGNSTTSESYTVASAWNALLNTAGWTLAIDATTANSGNPAISQSSTTGSVKYNSGSTFGVTGTSPTTTYSVLEFSWNAAYATPSLAQAAGSAVGWSSVIQYTFSTASDQTQVNMPFAGYGTFIPASVPEPGTMALAALGGASLLLFRRRK